MTLDQQLERREEAPAVTLRAAGDRNGPILPTGLTARQEWFCQEYLLDLNATRAAIRAGYSTDSARQIGSQNLSKLDIQRRLTELMGARARRTGISQDRVLTQLAEWAYFDPLHAFKPDGTLKDLEDMPPEIRSCIVSIETQEVVIGASEAGHIRKVKFTDRLRSNELIGRHLGLFTDKAELGAGEKLEALLAESWRVHDKEGPRLNDDE